MGRHHAVDSGAARFVGRVGALAVAIGIGTAVAGGGGIARADDGAASDATASNDANSSAGSGTAASTDQPGRRTRPTVRTAQDAPAETPRYRRPERDKGVETEAAEPDGSRPAKEVTRWSDRFLRTVGGDGAKESPVRPERAEKPRRTARPAAAASDESGGPQVSTPAGPRDRETRTLGPRVREAVIPKAAPVSASATVSDDDTIAAASAGNVTTVAVTPRVTASPPAAPVATAVSNFLAAVGIASPFGVGNGDAPRTPMPLALGLLQLVRRELEISIADQASEVAPSTVAARSLAAAAVAPVDPQPGDHAATEYGNIGKWMLKPNGGVANWGGQQHDGRTLVEPVNVVIVDNVSTTREESIRRVNAALASSGFPASAPHSGGYRGLIGDTVYGQQPSGFLLAYSTNTSPNHHGRLFGPAPAPDGQGFVWTGSFSTQATTHGYLSFEAASEELADRLEASGAAQRLDDVDLDNVVDTATRTTGDHDGRAVVLVLRNRAPELGEATSVKTSATTGKVTGKVSGTDADRDTLTYTATNSERGGTVTVTSTGSFTYTPTAEARHAAAAEDGDTQDTFTITVDDGHGGVTEKQITVPVVPKNTAPTVKATVNKPDPVAGTVTGSIVATDKDGDTAGYEVISAPTSGSVSVAGDGTFTYTPTEPARQRARETWARDTDKFTVRVDDGHGGMKTITVTTTIAPTNQAPTATLQETSGPSATGAVKGSLTATDPDDDSVTFSGSTRTAKGSVSVSSTGKFTYTPTAAARHAAASETASAADKVDTFMITATDKYGATTTVEVEVEVAGKNAAPRKSSLSVAAQSDSADGTVTGRLRATDADRDTLTYSASPTAKGGTVTVHPDGSFTYVPTEAARHAAAAPNAPAEATTDTFTIFVRDGHHGEAAVPVTVKISPLPEATTVSV